MRAVIDFYLEACKFQPPEISRFPKEIIYDISLFMRIDISNLAFIAIDSDPNM
jgi:hypothetical protein